MPKLLAPICITLLLTIATSQVGGAQSDTQLSEELRKRCGEPYYRCFNASHDDSGAEAICVDQLQACVMAAAGKDDADANTEGDPGIDSGPQPIAPQPATSDTKTEKSPRCKAALEFLESPSGLLGEWDKLGQKYKIRSDGISNFREQKKDLETLTMKWATSSGPEVAAAIKMTADLVNDTFAAVSPTGKAIDTLKDFSLDFAGTSRAQRGEKLYEIVEKAGDLRPAVERELSDYLVEKYLSRAGQIGAGIKLLKHLGENFQQLRKMPSQREELTNELQSQLAQLDGHISEYQAQMASDSDRMEFITTYQAAVTRLCAEDQPNPTEVGPPR